MSERVLRPATYGIITRDDSILLCRLSQETMFPGYWTLPGGGLEFGEHPEEALKREIYEETGLTATHWDFLQIQSEVEDYRGRTFHVLRFFYRVNDFSGNLRIEVGGSTDLCEWVQCADLEAFPTVPIVRYALSLT
jgi:8-oxo-dGTP diphosphatase